MSTEFAPDYSVSLWQVISDEMGCRGMDQMATATAMCAEPVTEWDVGVAYLTLDFIRDCQAIPGLRLDEQSAQGLERALGISATVCRRIFDRHHEFLAARDN